MKLWTSDEKPNERTLEGVTGTFEEHCHPKKNGVVEWYKFSTRVQEEGESTEKLVTALKLLVSTCNFGTLQDSLVWDRIFCRIRKSTLCKDLLKSANLYIEKCLQSYRVNELSKDRSKEIKTSDSVNALQSQARGKKPWQEGWKDAKQPKRKCYKCTYCGTKHEEKKCISFTVQSDNKPLEIIYKKPLHRAPNMARN